MQLFIVCPTQGEEADSVHALADLALLLGYDTSIVHDAGDTRCTAPRARAASRSSAVDAPSSLVLVSESGMGYLDRFSNIRRAVWWGRTPTNSPRSQQHQLERAALDPGSAVVHLARSVPVQRALAARGSEAQLITPNDPDTLFALLARAQATC